MKLINSDQLKNIVGGKPNNDYTPFNEINPNNIRYKDGKNEDATNFSNLSVKGPSHWVVQM